MCRDPENLRGASDTDEVCRKNSFLDNFEFWSFYGAKHDPFGLRKAAQRKKFQIENFLDRISKK